MLIKDVTRLGLLQQARHEIRKYRGQVPDPSFYERKLGECWRRARGSCAYAQFTDFSMEAFRAIPVTSKNALKADPWKYVVGGLDRAVKYYETTGTSGSVTPTPRFTEDVIWNTVAVGEAWRPIFGSGDRMAVVLPSDVVPVADMIAGVCEYLDVPHSRCYPFASGICNFERLVELLRRLSPTVIAVAPGVAVQLTRFLKQRGLLPDLRASVRAILLLGEVSTAALRHRVASWWEAEVYDASYGSTETGTLAATCAAGRLHLLTATNYFEVDGGRGLQPVTAGSSGHLVVTPLNLHARPLIRLDTEDLVTIGGTCGCGDGTPVLTVHGRAAEQLRILGSELTVRSVEEIVFETTSATGYLIEAAADGLAARLLLERDVDAVRESETSDSEAAQDKFDTRLGFRWDEIVFVNTLPLTTKSGASQKSWKRTNVRTAVRAD